MATDDEKFRERLKAALARPGRSQSGLARALGLDSSAVNRMVNGKRDLRVRELDKIAEYLRDTGGSSSEFAELAIHWDLARELDGLDTAAEDKLTGQESRSLFIAAGSALEEAILAALLRASPIKTMAEIEAFVDGWMDGGDPTMGAKTLYLMGAVDKDFSDDIRTIAQLRNEAAHDTSDPQFPRGEALLRFEKLLEKYADHTEESMAEGPTHAALYLAICSAIALYLTTGGNDQTEKILNRIARPNVRK